MNFTSKLNLQYMPTNTLLQDKEEKATQPTASDGFYLKALSPTLARCTTNLPTQIF